MCSDVVVCGHATARVDCCGAQREGTKKLVGKPARAARVMEPLHVLPCAGDHGGHPEVPAPGHQVSENIGITE